MNIIKTGIYCYTFKTKLQLNSSDKDIIYNNNVTEIKIGFRGL